MTAFRDITALIKAQNNGAKLEYRHNSSESWRSLSLALSDYAIKTFESLRLKAPEGVPDHLEWTGAYDVPTGNNCDAWLDSHKWACTWKHYRKTWMPLITGTT